MSLTETNDTFEEFARYYDPIMREIDYDRWLVIATYLADLIPSRDFRHVDIGCGTGKLTKKLIQHGWNSVGVDLSLPMLRTARRGGIVPEVVSADMRALPFSGQFDYATCLFDSLNFMLSPEDLNRAVRQIARASTDDALFYFDVVTERMVLEFFADRKWTEDNGQFSTTWEGRYDPETRVSSTQIDVHGGPSVCMRERAHTTEEIEHALADAGYTVLGMFDARTWCKPTRKSIRIDIVATKSDAKRLRKKFRTITDQIAGVLA